MCDRTKDAASLEYASGVRDMEADAGGLGMKVGYTDSIERDVLPGPPGPNHSLTFVGGDQWRANVRFSEPVEEGEQVVFQLDNYPEVQFLGTIFGPVSFTSVLGGDATWRAAVHSRIHEDAKVFVGGEEIKGVMSCVIEVGGPPRPNVVNPQLEPRGMFAPKLTDEEREKLKVAWQGLHGPLSKGCGGLTESQLGQYQRGDEISLQSANPDAIFCDDCNGTREYHGLNTVEPCKTCCGEKPDV